MANTSSTRTLAIPEAFLTVRAVNEAANKIRDGFTAIEIDRPVPFVSWQHRLDKEQVERLQQLFCGRGTKSDAHLLQLAEQTLRDMGRNRITRKAA